MATVMKTPGVYIVEKNAFPNSVVEVATAVPAFIGYTETAGSKEKPLKFKPRRITSMAEYHKYFGFAPQLTFKLTTTAPGVDDAAPIPAGPPTAVATMADDTEVFMERDSIRFHLYYSMLLFFQNGGGPCYIVSVGDYSAAPDEESLRKGIDALVKEQEPTMLVLPDAVLLDKVNCANVQKYAMKHSRELQSRIAILDVFQGYKDRTDDPDCIAAFRNDLGVNDLDYAAAYYPWLETTAMPETALSFKNFSAESVPTLTQLLKEEAGIPETIDPEAPGAAKQTQRSELIDMLGTELEPADATMLNKGLIAASPLFNDLLKQIQEDANLLPPSATMAGIYTMVDNTRGVWKAPANVSLAGVIKPAVNISHDEQEDLNVTPQGKSVNAIRTFIGEGTLVWGARTLDGNSLDWRYISVRRTMIMLEQSIKLATKAYVFEANDANTWVTIKSMIRNFLTGIWKRGGLAGASPDDAFSVNVGLGETMTSEDILEGILRVTVLVAVTRPAEFIEITFQQQMQKS